MERLAIILVFVVNAVAAFAQTEGARISGRVTDLSGAVIVGTECKITNLETNVSTTTTTNADGIYVIPDLHPATYRLTIEKDGFRTVVQPSLQIYAQDAIDENFTLALGPRSESITVLYGVGSLETDSASVSTMVDQQFVDNLPLNGRSFQALITLAPGVVLTSTNLGPGQFSVNGQRSDANYFTVDGVSANFGVDVGALGQAVGGAIPAFTSQGGTNGFVSVDDMQEFRIQTSSYAPEFGRTPGGQVSIVTKSGTNQFHGTAYDYLRNDIFDARNYFDAPPLPKPPLRQNDFGGTFGGPIVKDKTFFFLSYEGLRLRLPQTTSGDFYTPSARAAFAPVYQPFLNALPLPDPGAPVIDPTCDNITNPCEAMMTAAYSNPSNLNATSIRIDQNLKKSSALFARYSHAPSYDATRDAEELHYSNVSQDTITAGATITFSSNKLNDFRGNWSRATAIYSNSLTDFHGAVVPSDSLLFPLTSPYQLDTGQALIYFPDGTEVRRGLGYDNSNSQLNFVDTIFWAVGTHQLKFGIDYRRLHPTDSFNTGYALFPSISSLMTGTVDTALLDSSFPFSVNLNNVSLFVQDTWKPTSRLTLTYGLRWEINTSPSAAMSGAPIYVTQGIFDSNPLAVVPGSLWHTRFGNFAPRIGAAFQITPATVVRGGFGLFYDLGYGGAGNSRGPNFPYDADRYLTPAPAVPFDLTNPIFQPPPFSTTIDPNALYMGAVDPNLRLPVTLEWNAALERQLDKNQTLSLTYVGADGRSLLRGDTVRPPALTGGGTVLAIRNAGYSHYNAFQVQFQRRLSHGLQALVSYNLAKSSDLGSDDSSGLLAPSLSQVVLPPLTPSDFDLRNSFAGAVSYELPSSAGNHIGDVVLKGWAIDGLVRVTSAPPINVTVYVNSPVSAQYETQAKIVPGQPFWIADPTQPSGTALNPAAFTTLVPGQQGDFPRNGLRSPYSIDQTDLALRRRFRITDRVNLNVRAEYFNAFNHPMFGAPGANEPDTAFGPGFGKLDTESTANLLLGGGAAQGGQSPLYALGGPRSAQFTVKLQF